MGNSPAETELMHRALHEIERLLSTLEESAREHQCLPRDEHAAQAFTPPGTRQQPAKSALYFCLTSASALLDVSRTLLRELEDAADDRSPSRHALGELSKAAGQSAFLAAVMLADPHTHQAPSARHAETWTLTRPCRAPAAPRRAHIGMRFKATLRTLFDVIAT
jgi:hypothetical protein